MNKPTFKFLVDAEFICGTERLCDTLGFECGNGIEVRATKCDKNGVVLKGNNATIYYTKKNLFFRQLAKLVASVKRGEEIDDFDDGFFTDVSTMIDASRCAVPTVKTMCRLLDRLAIMGYDMAMLYTEDTVKLENYRYFGYLRGAYTREELKAIDDYAYEYGIEMIPCIECYGHMARYLIWGEAAAIKDTDKILLAREEKTFIFLEELISTVSSCFRSNRIHIGMDEAWGMGRGKFMDKHGFVEPFDIFSEYMDRLVAITGKYGLKPMMWSDMYFRNGSPTHQYYDENIVIPDEVAARIPEEMQLVFWHYQEAPGCDDFMLKKHKALNRDVIFAGGLWSWTGHFPEHNYAIKGINCSLEACRNNDVRDAMITIWSNDNAECDLFANLYGLSYFVERCFDKDADDAKIARRFEETSGGCAEAFLAMSAYHNDFDNYSYENFNTRFLGKPVFWCDVMTGIFDTHLFEKPMSGHYAAYAEKMKSFSGGEWDYLYRFAEKIFEYQSLKSLVTESLVPAYKSGDREKLAEIADKYLPALKEKLSGIHKTHKALWYDKLKMQGWQMLDCRYGGLIARFDTASELIKGYLNGEYETLSELDEPRLKRPLNAFINYSRITMQVPV